jgi:hypothetical protein
MEEALETVLGILRNGEGGMDFIDLVRRVTAGAQIDEATAKASILRLHFEGKVKIDSEWSVCLVPTEPQVLELVTVAA